MEQTDHYCGDAVEESNFRILLEPAQHWRDHAEEVLWVAERMSTPQAAHIMEQVAAGYQSLAERAERPAAAGQGRRQRGVPAGVMAE